MDWVRDHATIALVGNRDLDHVDLVRPDLQRLVQTWPREAQASNFVLSHGDPSLHRILNSGAIRDGFRRAHGYLAAKQADLWFFGHTHWARVWQVADPEPLFLDGNNIQFHEAQRYVINVGTAGLPRAGRGGVSMTFYDDAARTLEIVPLESADALVYSKPVPMEV
jgi:predicted phosphodiesterase